MKKVFIDLGTHFGNGLSSNIKNYEISQDWEIHTFEPNVFTFKKFQDLRSSIKNPHPNYSWIFWKNIEYHNKAAWIYDGEIEFNCATVESSKNMAGEKRFEDYLDLCRREIESGESLTVIHDLDSPTNAASTIISPVLIDKEGHNFIQKSIEFRKKDKITASCIDFSMWIKNNFNEDDFIVVKMDIEGAEYFVLEKMISDGIPKSLKEMNIEWHDWNIPGRTEQESKIGLFNSKKFIFSSFENAGVKLGSWI